MIKENAVTRLHDVTNEVADLIVANAEPGHAMVGSIERIINGAFTRFCFHEPKAGSRLEELIDDGSVIHVCSPNENGQPEWVARE